MNNTIPVSHIIAENQYDLIEKNIKDSPYTSSYTSKGKRKKSKELGSKENLQKVSKSKINRGEKFVLIFRRKQIR
jgi:hypothetical protein